MTHTPITIYLYGGTAALVALPPLPAARMTRQDAMIVLSETPGPGGSFRLESGGAALQGNAALVAPFTEVDFQSPGTRTVFINVHLTHPRFRSVRACAVNPINPLDRASLASFEPDFLRAGVGGLDVEGATRLIDGVLDVLLAGRPEPPPLDPRVQIVMAKIEQDLGYPFERLAEEAGLSPSRLSHLFSATLGVSFRSFVAWARLMLAWELVALAPEMSFTQIAHQMGYSDSSHLARSFQAFLGVTPTLARNKSAVTIVGTPLPMGRHLPWMSGTGTQPRE